MSTGDDYELVEQTPAELVTLSDSLVTREWTDEDFDVDGVGVRPFHGTWLLMLGVHDPGEGSPADHPVATWTEAYLRAAVSSWGEPTVHTPRRSPDTGTPDGIVDLLLGTFDLDQALVWDRGSRIVVVFHGWRGAVGASRYVTCQLILPRESYVSGIGAFLSEEVTIFDRIMHGEALTELHRRAYVLASVNGVGEVTTEGSPVAATRCEYRVDADHWAQWTFTADGRALVLFHDTDVRGLLDAGHEDTQDEALSQIAELCQGIPDDLLDCVSSPGVSSAGERTEPAGFAIGGRMLPAISGAFWYDGQTWKAPTGLLEHGARFGVGIDDVGFEECVRRPMRLGGDFGPADDEGIALATKELIESAPYPAGPRPEGRIRLGYAIPDDTHEQLLDQIETAAEAWWTSSIAGDRRDDKTCTVGGRLVESDDDNVLFAPLAHAEPWYADAFDEWMSALHRLAHERWGDPGLLSVHAPDSGNVIRNPVTRYLRGQGFAHTDFWWVNGMAVSIMHGYPDPSNPEDYAPGHTEAPQAVVLIAPADAILEPMRGTRLRELRYQVRVIAALANARRDVISWHGTQIGARANKPDTMSRFHHPGATADAVRYVFPRLATPEGVPARGNYCAWYFTHDNRALLVTRIEGSPFDVLATGSDAPRTGEPTPFERQAALFAGTPDDLMSLVADRAEDTRMITIAGPRGRTLPAATGVYWFNGLDWRASRGLLEAVHDHLGPGPGTTPTDVLLGAGLQAAVYAAAAGTDFDSHFVAANPGFSQAVFGRIPAAEEIGREFGSLGRPEHMAMSRTLNDFLDVQCLVSDLDFMVPAALSNPDPSARSELTLWLLAEGASAVARLSHSSTVHILLDNEVLDPATDPLLLRSLMRHGAARDLDRVAPRVRGGGHPVIQLCDRDLDETALEPFYRELFDGAFVDVDRPLLAGGQSVSAYVRAGVFPHSRDRSVLMKYIDRCRDERGVRAGRGR